MNERIKELAKQTAYIWHASGDPQIYEFTPEKLDKFAELIVRECTNICRSDDWEDQQGWGKMYAHKIQKQFGIEE